MTPEILAPAGGPDSLLAAIRTGADAVYLGGKSLNARRAAKGFDRDQLRAAVGDCHTRGVKVYLTLNILVFDSELPQVLEAVAEAADLGVDGVLVQDLAVARLVRERAPRLPLHASTQLSIHNLAGARLLEQLGFSRVVLARELSREEIRRIRDGTSLELEVFVHGALCMCVSGQCYLSSVLGGRSGNRGLCAGPCRLPFQCAGKDYALSLKDLSLIPRIGELRDLGVAALKIEGRMKRPEYVAAAVTACREALAGGQPDYKTLEAVFSRSGFTDGYYTGRRDAHMFGRRLKDDVAEAAPVLGRLAALYRAERQAVPVSFYLSLARERPAALRAADGNGNAVTVTGPVPEEARSAPTTPERAQSALEKTGGTFYTVSNISTEIDKDLLLPAASLNGLRRDALTRLTDLRSRPTPIPCDSAAPLPSFPPPTGEHRPLLRVRLDRADQLTGELWALADQVVLPVETLAGDRCDLPGDAPEKAMVEIPPILFNNEENLENLLHLVKKRGISRAVAGTLGSVAVGLRCGMELHGDAGLNLTNALALDEAARLGLSSATLSVELSRGRIAHMGRPLPVGIWAYGHLPLMYFRNCPAGSCARCKDAYPEIVDRKGTRFFLSCTRQVAALHNPVPLYLADRLGDFPVDFFTLYFTRETPDQCLQTLRLYRAGEPSAQPLTRGLYYRKVL